MAATLRLAGESSQLLPRIVSTLGAYFYKVPVPIREMSGGAFHGV
jgi:hypothetical protein